ncbi:DEAD/DEAH box helicase [Roseibacillus ishigakijimensis]|uniref:DEAD/DEAH box helicase n=2 Tax=Roseibacillus ishigakijimensis TaxID=454146 RepID=A0A934VGA8_9BACT|nr:DEAD/DEAH box helicase [Roseibacillus ishigakijimensis]
MAHPFLALGVSADFVKGLAELGIEKPTPIQRKVIPHLLKDGRDYIAQAQTGTGKTAAFGLPLLARAEPGSPAIQALVVAPTRELAKQIGKQLFRYTKFSAKVFVEVVSGGDPIDRQVAALRRPTQIVVGTPGRILDLIERKALDLSQVRHLVLDEADEMLSMGFQKQLDQIFRLTPQRKGTWLFSATFPPKVESLVERHLSPKAPFLQVQEDQVVNKNIDHRYAVMEQAEKDDYIMDFLEEREGDRGLIFCRTKAGATALTNQLRKRGFGVEVLQGDMTQKERDKVMRAFKKERVPYLVATDVAARGIDVANLAFVIHHQLPDQIEYYTHRSGRTARAGKSGLSLVLLEPKQRPRLKKLASTLHIEFREHH